MKKLTLFPYQENGIDTLECMELWGISPFLDFIGDQNENFSA